MNDKKPINCPERVETFIFVPEDFEEGEVSAINNFELFDQILQAQLDQTRKVLGFKGKEYSKDGDRFSNFKDAARHEEVSPEKALLGMMIKHEVSVRDIVANIENKLPSEAMLDEKIGDWINYLILLKGLITERIRHAKGNI